MDNRIGLNIKKLRTYRGMSSRHLSSLIGKNPNAASSYETGKTKPPAEVIYKLSEIFEVPPGAIMSGDLSDPEVLKAATSGSWSSLNADERKQVLREKNLLHEQLDKKESTIAKALAELSALEREIGEVSPGSPYFGRIQALKELLKS